ncbi:MAG: prolipoprotein diacylglyceryl transferase [Bacillota bacterium]|nr:prolipoprotein diacylglyceryl transferase [Bacillota bacterium]
MYNDLFTIGGVTVHGYGLMIAIGIIAAYTMADYRAKLQGINRDKLYILTIWAAVLGILGAKVLYLITMAPKIAEDPSLILKDLASGFVVYGGIIGGLFGGIAVARVIGMPVLRTFDLCMPSIALAQGFGRIGCLLAGCCYGMEYSGPGAIVFSHSDFAPNGVSLFPSEPVYAVLNFAHCLILLAAFRKLKNVPGRTGSLYLIFYSIGRFMMEFVRGDAIRGSVGVLSTSQFIAIFILILGAFAYAFAPKLAKFDLPLEEEPKM